MEYATTAIASNGQTSTLDAPLFGVVLLVVLSTLSTLGQTVESAISDALIHACGSPLTTVDSMLP